MNPSNTNQVQDKKLEPTKLLQRIRTAAAVSVVTMGSVQVASAAVVYDALRTDLVFNDPNFTVMDNSGEDTVTGQSDFAYWTIGLQNPSAETIKLGVIKEALDATVNASSYDLKISDVVGTGAYASNPLGGGVKTLSLVPESLFDSSNPTANALWTVNVTSVTSPILDIGNRNNAGDVLLYSFNINADLPSGAWRLVSTIQSSDLVFRTEEAHAPVLGQINQGTIVGNVPFNYNEPFSSLAGPSYNEPALHLSTVVPEPTTATFLVGTLGFLMANRNRSNRF